MKVSVKFVYSCNGRLEHTTRTAGQFSHISTLLASGLKVNRVRVSVRVMVIGSRLGLALGLSGVYMYAVHV